MKNKRLNFSVLVFFLFLLLGMAFSLSDMSATLHAEEAQPIVQEENTPSVEAANPQADDASPQEDNGTEASSVVHAESEANENVDTSEPQVSAEDGNQQTVKTAQVKQQTASPRVVLRAPAAAAEIYLNGVSGNDANDGTSLENAVKTFARAKALALQNTTIQTIYVTGTVDITGDISLDGTNAVIKRHASFNNYLLQVKTGATATLSNITIDGNSEAAAGTTKSLVYVRGTLNIEEGTVLQNNVLTDLGYFRAMGGAVLIDFGTVNMTGGVIQNNTANFGGGVFVNYGTFNMSGGTIQDNHAVDGTSDGLHGAAAGGGVIVYDGSTFNLSGDAVIQNNTSANLGGGISIGSGVGSNGMDTLNMTGGIVTGNTAGSSGGGILVQAGYTRAYGTANISGGQITNNRMTAEGTENNAFGGGGIYVNGYSNSISGYHNGILNLTNAIIKTNTADMEGGGYASCPNSETHIYVKNGVALYGNKAKSANEIYILASNNYGVHSGDPIYSISPSMLGGTPYNWKDEDGIEVPLNQLSGQLFAINNESLSLHTDAVETDSVLNLAKVIISGNTSATRGAGIGSNGTVNMGESEETEVEVTKQWDDFANKDNKRPDRVIVELYRGSEEKVYIGYETVEPDADGNWMLTFINLPKTDADGNEYVYSVKEQKADGYTGRVSGNMSDGYTIRNILSTQVQVQKVWSGTIGKAVTVQLLANGQKTTHLLTLNAANNWMGSFIDLAKYDESGAEIQYSVSEDAVSGVNPEHYMVTVTGNMSDGFTITNKEKVTPPKEKETPPEKKTKREEEPSTSKTEAENQTIVQQADTVQTGFHTNGFIWFALILISGFGICGLIKRNAMR